LGGKRTGDKTGAADGYATDIGTEKEAQDARHEAHSNEIKVQRSRGEIYNISKATKQGVLLRGDS